MRRGGDPGALPLRGLALPPAAGAVSHPTGPQQPEAPSVSFLFSVRYARSLLPWFFLRVPHEVKALRLQDQLLAKASLLVKDHFIRFTAWVLSFPQAIQLSAWAALLSLRTMWHADDPQDVATLFVPHQQEHQLPAVNSVGLGSPSAPIDLDARRVRRLDSHTELACR